MRSALTILLLLAPAAARAASALVVLNEPLSSSYQEALDGLRAEMGEELEIAPAGRPLPPGPHGVIIAFGGRAALRAQKAGAPLVVALAPYYRGEDGPRTVRVALTPSPEKFASFLAAAGVKRLLAVRSSAARSGFIARAVEAGKLAGVEIEDGILSAPDDLPDLLRVSGERADAIWLAPDPAVVTPETFAVVREFARARAIPFFAPAAGLVSEEIRGELTVTFRDCGREAGRAANELLSGRDVAKVVYPARSSGAAPIAKSTVPASAP